MGRLWNKVKDNKSKLKYAGLGLLTAFCPIIGLPVASAYLGTKGGEKIGDYFYNNPDRVETPNIDTEEVNDLENVYLSEDSFNKYFDDNKSEGFGYVKSNDGSVSAKKFIKTGESDDLLYALYEMNEVRNNTGNDDVIRSNRIRDSLNILNFKDEVMDNLEDILDGYDNASVLNKEEYNGEDYYKLGNNFTPSMNRRYYFDGDDLHFLNPEYDYSEYDNITIIKPHQALGNKITEENSEELLKFMNPFEKVLIDDGVSVSMTEASEDNMKMNINNDLIMTPNLVKAYEASA